MDFFPSSHWRGVCFLMLNYRHTTAMEGQRNLLDFRFQVKGSVFPIHTKVLDDGTSFLCSKGAFSNCLEGVALKHFSWGKTPAPHSFLLPLPQLSFSSAILGLLLFNPKIVRLFIATFVYSLISESIYGSNSMRDKIMFASVRR